MPGARRPDGELLVDERGRHEDLDPVPAGADDALGPEVVEDPHDDLPDGADGVGECLLAHGGDEPIALLPLGGEVEQVPCDALPDRREGAVRDLGHELHDPLAELVDDGAGNAQVPLRKADHDVAPEADQLGVDQRLDRRGQRVAGREQRDGAREVAAAQVADRQAPAVGSADQDAQEPVHEELEVRSGRADITDDRARRNVDPLGAIEERGGDVRWQVTQVRLRPSRSNGGVIEECRSPDRDFGDLSPGLNSAVDDRW